MQKDLSAQAIIAIEKLLGKFRPQECPPMKSAVVSLYTCDSTGVLKYSGLIGLLRL